MNSGADEDEAKWQEFWEKFWPLPAKRPRGWPKGKPRGKRVKAAVVESKAAPLRRRKDLGQRVCPWCQSSFRVRHGRQRFCCVSCRQSWGNASRPMPAKKQRVCVECGAALVAEARNAKLHLGRECQRRRGNAMQKARRLRDRQEIQEWRKRHPKPV